MAILAATLLSGCVSVRSLGPVPMSGAGAGVELRVFASDAARRGGAPSPRYVESVLERREGDRWVPVFRSLDPAWRVESLEPGRYRVSLPSVLDPEGEPVPIDVASQVVRVRTGELARVEANLDHVPRAAIAAGVVGAVIVGVVLHERLDGLDLPAPPPELLDVAFHVTLDIALWSAEPRPTRPLDRPPVVTSVFPETDALVAASRLRIVLAFSEPLVVVEPDALRVVGERSGPIPGRTSWDPEHWWLVWEPDGPLPRNEAIRFELVPGRVRDQGGLAPASGVRSFFRTTR